MEQALNSFSVDVRYQISGSKASLESWRAFVDLHDQVMHGVKVRVAKINTNGSDGEAETLWTSSDNDWSVQSVDQGGQVSAW